MKKKNTVRRVLPWMFMLAILGGIGYVGYLLWGMPESEPLYTAEVIRQENDQLEPVVLDNGFLHMEIDPLTSQFVLSDANGHEWKSNPFPDPETSGETVASGENRNALASTLNVYYRLPKKAVDNMYDNYTYSISRSAFQINQIDSSTASVTYSVGDIAREYMIPSSLTKERYEELSDAVKASGSSKKKFTGKFTSKKTKDILSALTSGKPKEAEEASAFAVSYPQVVGQDIHLLNVTDNNNMGALESLLKGIGYGEEEKNLDIILSRSSFRYKYHHYTPEEIVALQGGSEEERVLAERILEKNADLVNQAGYILQRTDQVFTPGMVEALLSGTDEQIAYANRLISEHANIQNDPVTIIPLNETERVRVYTVAELLDEEQYDASERLLEAGVFAASEHSVDVLFDVTVYYRLEGKDFVAEVPYSGISFNSANASISYISVLPMFGAVGAQADGTYEDGYLLVPEGGGALIRFNNRKLKQTGYYTDVYGYDYGIKRSEFVTEAKASYPVFGILRQDQSFICIIEDGAALASIQANINGNAAGTERSSYNCVNAKSQVLHVDNYNVGAKTSELQLMYEKVIPDVSLVQRYRFGKGLDYAELAASYGDYLREKYPSLKEKKSSEDVPVSVELIGAIDKRVVIAGLPVQKVVATTTFTQGKEILDELRKSGIRNLNARYTGWLRGGIKQKALTSVRVLNELGGDQAAALLIREAENSGIPLFFDGMTAFVYDSGLTDGFFSSRDAARHITREIAELNQYSPIYYTKDDEYESYYLANPEYAGRNAEKLINWLKDKGACGVTFRDIGVVLSADYNPGRVIGREEVRELNIMTLLKAREADEQIMIKNGFDFTLPYADIITDMELDGNHYVLLDRRIPFYQMAIHGMIDYTGEAMNLQGDYQTELLRSIEYGAGLNYAFTAESASVTQETHYTGLYGTTFASWEEEAKDTVLRYQKSAAGLNSQRITGHGELSEYVKVTTYEDGTRVYVNYGTDDYRGEVLVPARDYLIVGEEVK